MIIAFRTVSSLLLSSRFIGRFALNEKQYTCTSCIRQYHPIRVSRPVRYRWQQRRYASQQPADDPEFTSIVDHPPILIRTNRKHNIFGLLILAAIPITSFALGCWQVQRLGWKTDLIARFEDRILREPLPLPPRLDPAVIKDFDFRRVLAKGVLRHDQEMLIGPRLHDGQDGYLVVTPLDRSAEFPASLGNTKILVSRGWIPKSRAAQSSRAEGLPTGVVTIEGLLREPIPKNAFTPKNDPDRNIWHFADVYEMAEHTGSQAVWIEETMQSDLITAYQREELGIPLARGAEVNLRNNHAQYIFTWFSLSAATSVMLWMIMKRPGSGIKSRVRQNRGW